MERHTGGLSDDMRQKLMEVQQRAKEKAQLPTTAHIADDAASNASQGPAQSLNPSQPVDLDPDSIFLPADESVPASDPASDPASGPAPAPLSTGPPGSPKRAHSPPTDDVGSGVEEIQPPSKKRSKSGKAAAKSSSLAKEKTPAKKPKKSRKKTIEERAQGLANFNNLFNQNVHRDVAANQGRTDALIFTSTHKNKALKEIVDSIPLEDRSTARVDLKRLHTAASGISGNCLMDAKTGGWMMTGMLSALTHYQMLGVSFMVGRESGGVAPAGGLLADTMGLGKTVMVIATIINGRSVIPEGRKTTLIVVNSSIILQWHMELEKHAREKELGKVGRFHSGCHFKEKRTTKSVEELIQIMLSYDIVLTTYGEVSKSYPKQECPPEIDNDDDYDQWWKAHFEENRGIFHSTKFKRVVLDEAQHIKNHTSHVSMACRALDSDYRWAITATPVMNSLTEFFPYFDFLRVPNSGSFEVFQENYRKTAQDATGSDRLHARLSQFMIRRTHQDTLLGTRLLTLPDLTENTYFCHFSDIERRIYDVVKRRFAERINLIGKYDSKKMYSNALVLLLRLRQLVGHISLIQDTIRDLLTPGDLEEIRMILSMPVPPHSNDESLIRHLRMMLRNVKALPVIETVAPTEDLNDADVEEAPDNESATAEGVDGTHAGSAESAEAASSTEHNAGPTAASSGGTETDAATTRQPLPVGGRFGLKNSYASFFKALEEEQQQNRPEVLVTCSKCLKQPPVDPHVTNCGHIYCNECLLIISYDNSSNGLDRNKCLECDADYSGTTPCDVVGRELVVDVALEAPPKKKKGKGKAKVAAKTSKEEEKKLSARKIIEKWVDADGHMLPSAKTLAVKAQILNWHKDDPTAKIIVYTQFMSMIYILEKMCEHEGWGCLLYHGSMTAEKRNKAIQNFESDASSMILLTSLKAGGTGLNLTMASRVILVDLWWNNAMEQQAFCRVFRKGQEKQTYMTRLAVSQTVDQDLIRMQERKENEIGTVMVENGRARMSANELMSLFGQVGHSNGRAFIITDH